MENALLEQEQFMPLEEKEFINYVRGCIQNLFFNCYFNCACWYLLYFQTKGISNYFCFTWINIHSSNTIGVAIELEQDNYLFKYPFTDKAIKMLKNNGIKVFAFTNQPGISMGEAKEEDFINELTGFGIEKAYICPHSQEYNCKCRKPETGLLLKAETEYKLDQSKCIVIGDRWSDMMAAERADMRKILVLTGSGNESLGKHRAKWSDIDPDYIANNVLEAIEWILKI